MVKNAAIGAKRKNLERKEMVSQGKRRLPPRPSLDRACKRKIQLPCNMNTSSDVEATRGFDRRGEFKSSVRVAHQAKMGREPSPPTVMRTHVQAAGRIQVACMKCKQMEGLEPLLPTQGPSVINMQSYTVDEREEEVAGTSTIIENSAAKEKKEKVQVAAVSAKEKILERKEVISQGKRRLQARSQACKRKIQQSRPT